MKAVRAYGLKLFPTKVLKDLMNPTDKALKIREHPDLGIYVEGLSSLVVTSSESVLKLIDQGNAVRKVAATAMNQRSSRSHSCLTLRIERKTKTFTESTTKETALNAKLNLVRVFETRPFGQLYELRLTWLGLREQIKPVPKGND